MTTREFRLHLYTVLRDYIGSKYITFVEDASKNSVRVTTIDDSVFLITVSRVSCLKKESE